MKTDPQLSVVEGGAIPRVRGRLARLRSAMIAGGVEATMVTVEVHRGGGVPQITIVGMAGTAVRESLQRIHTAFGRSGLPLKSRATTINLAPASEPKAGAGLDLPIALGLLVADGEVPAVAVDGRVCLGELGLDGAVRPGPGILPVALAALQSGVSRLLIPAANLAEVADLPGIDAVGVRSLRHAFAVLRGEASGEAVKRRDPEPEEQQASVDLGDVVGQAIPRRALEVAAAGGHHVLMVGPPGAGKTMLARALPGILPSLTFEETVEVSTVYSVVGRLTGKPLLRRRPFRAPHHSTTVAGLLGGGAPPRPGEVSLAHHGVLFLDEMPEFRRVALESLRQPLEEGELTLVRGNRAAVMPARFQMVGAMNPCPCGRGPADDDCRCGEHRVLNYWQRVSGPLLDRIDLFVAVDRVALGSLITGATGPESSAAVRERVVAARGRQLGRLRELAEELDEAPPGTTNSAIPTAWIRRVCKLSPALRQHGRQRAEALELSARAWHRALRVARTIADLERRPHITRQDLDEAFQYRQRLDPFRGC